MKQRITNQTVEHNGEQFTITFKPDGLHIKKKFARGERVISILALITDQMTAPTKANRHLITGSPAETCHVASCDLNILSSMLHKKAAMDKKTIGEIRASVSMALKIVRSLELLA